MQSLNNSLKHVLLVSDMDDTLLTEKKEISQQDQQAIMQFRSMGGTFGIATGRFIPAFLPFIEVLKPSIPVILNNGAVLYDVTKREILWSCVLPTKIRDLLVKITNEFNHIGVEVLLEDKIYILKTIPLLEHFLSMEKFSYERKTLMDMAHIPDPWFKVIFITEPDQMSALQDFIQQHLSDGIACAVNGPSFCELIPEEASKGGGVSRLCNLMGFEDKKIYTIGDYFNDLSLLEVGDVSASVMHAPDQVQKKADIVFPTKHAIESFIKYIIKEESSSCNAG